MNEKRDGRVSVGRGVTFFFLGVQLQVLTLLAYVNLDSYKVQASLWPTFLWIMIVLTFLGMCLLIANCIRKKRVGIDILGFVFGVLISWIVFFIS